MLKLYSLFLLLNIIIIFCDGGNDEYDPYNGYEGNNDNYENYDNGWYYNNENNINTGTISYELSYDDHSIVKVIIQAQEEITKPINFKANLKSENEDVSYSLNCSNVYYDIIECLSKTNIKFKTENKYFLYYEKGKDGNLTFNQMDTLEDYRKISLIFKPEVKSNQILYKDNRKILVRTQGEMVESGLLYLVRKSKDILQKPKDGFNKNIELNNFIFRGGLAGYRPESTFESFEEAISRGYRIVDASIQFTKDKKPVISRASDLKEVSDGTGKITSKTLKELEKLDFGIKYGEKYKGEKILTFENLLILCKNKEIIIDLDLTLMPKEEYFKKTDEYLKIIVNLIEKHGMFNSIFFNEKSKEAILELMKIKKDLSFSVGGINSKESIEKIKDEFKGAKRIIYNFDDLSNGGKIDEETVKYALSLGKKVKASTVDNTGFATTIHSWGVNYITTRVLHPFLMKNNKEEPIVVRCLPSDEYSHVSECEIGIDIDLIDNEKYNIYYSENIYNISEDIKEEPIGEFEYIDTNLLEELYYSIVKFDFQKGILILNTTNTVRKGEEIYGRVGPDYDDVAECYKYLFVCSGENTKTVHCQIKKDDPEIVEFKGKYRIYNLEGYSLNPEEVNKKLNSNKKFYQKFSFYICVCIFVIIALGVMFYIIKNSQGERYNEVKMAENAYLSDNSLFR